MAVTKLTMSGFTASTFNKYDDFLAGNSAYIPSSFESIATATPTSGSTVTFSSIPSTYKHLQLRMNIMGVAGSNIYYRLNGNSSTTSYTWHVLEGDGTSASATAGTTDGFSLLNFNTSKPSTTAPFVSVLDILDYASTTKNKTGRSITGSNINTTSAAYGVTLGSGLWINTSAITSITITGSGVFATGTSIALYGIKGS